MIPSEICRNALIQGGIISIQQTIYMDDILKAFDQLNMMISRWNNDRFNIWSEYDISCVSTGNVSYDIGPTATNFPTDRPDKIMAAYARLLPIPASHQPNDTPLNIVEAYEDYATITTKYLTGFPMSVFYDSQFPIGNVFVWPIPLVGQFEIHLVLKKQIEQFNDLTTEIVMPPEYFDAMTWGLASMLRTSYKLPIDQTVNQMALRTMATVKGANSQVAILSMPMGFGTRRSGGNARYWYLTGGFS